MSSGGLLSTFLIELALHDIEGTALGALLVGEGEPAELAVDAQAAAATGQSHDDDVMTLVFDPEIPLGGGLPALELGERGTALGEVAQLALGGVDGGITGEVVGADAPDSDGVFPIVMGEHMHKANLLLAAELAGVVVALGAAFIALQIDGAQPAPAGLG